MELPHSPQARQHHNYSAVHIIVRFTTSTPDLPLTIERPATTSALSLKQRIRTHLPDAHNSARLRLIHAGKVIDDAAALSRALNLPAPPPRGLPSRLSHEAADTIKGKGPAADNDSDQIRVYIHCSISISAPLSTSDLHAEHVDAQTYDAALLCASPSSASHPHLVSSSDAFSKNPLPGATPRAPVGFDRLLAAGFSTDEIASLRAQFVENLSYTHTPDTLPAGAALLALEERWLDSTGIDSGGAAGVTGTGEERNGGIADPDDSNAWTGAVGGLGGDFGSADETGLDDMLLGNIVGFFWPLGAVVWGLREEGVWTRRRQMAVLNGIVVNLLFGFLRLTH